MKLTSTLLTKVFGRSPIGPIQQHIALVHECASKLIPFMDSVLAQDWDTAREVQKEINLLEEEADKKKKKIRLSLPKSLFLPVSRSDLLEIVTVQDKIANKAKDIAGLIFGRKMLIPDLLHELLIDFTHGSVKTSAQALKAIAELDELLEAGFQGREVDIVVALVDELDTLESDTDHLQIEIKKLLFTVEQDLSAIDVVFMYKMIDWIGDLADRASRVGHYLQILIAK